MMRPIEGLDSRIKEMLAIGHVHLPFAAAKNLSRKRQYAYFKNQDSKSSAGAVVTPNQTINVLL